MTTEDQSAASDVSEQTEPTETAQEQTNTESKPASFEDVLLKQAVEDGHTIGPEPPKAEAEPTVEPTEPETGEKALEPDAEPEVEKEPEVTAKTEAAEHKSIPDQIEEAKAKGEKPAWYLSRIAEETAKKGRANERAEKAEARAQELEQALGRAQAPVPTQDNPFIDVQDVGQLDHLEREYEKTIDLADDNPDALVEQIVAIEKKKTGVDPLERFTPEQIVSMAKKKADRAIRREIPERRTYLQQRADQDAKAAAVYPELLDPNSELRKTAEVLAHQVLTGQAQKNPELLIWIGHAAKGYLESLQRNGKDKAPEVKSSDGQRILESSRQKIAPAPTRTRSFTERRGSADLAKAEKKFEERHDRESAEDLVGAILARSLAGTKRLETIPE